MAFNPIKRIVTEGGNSLPRRLLLVAYYFPPQPKGCAPRLGHIARHLPEFGWDVTVVTPASYPRSTPRSPQIENGTIAARFGVFASSIMRKHRLIRRAVAFGASIWRAPGTWRAFPDSTMWWYRPALRHIADLMVRERYDAILTSHSACADHLIGAAVARRYGIPWLADYQDLWAGNGGSTKSALRKRIERLVERHAVARARAITCCKESFIEKLRDVLGARGGANISVIPFAVDLETWQQVADVPPSEFRIVFAGNLYPRHVTPSLLFASLARLTRENHPAGREASFHYYGFGGQLALEVAREHGIENVVDHGLVAHDDVLAAQRQAALLVSIVNPDSPAPNPRVWFPSKLFEYAGANRRILAIGPPGSIIEQFVRESGLGYFASDEQSCMRAIERAYGAYRAGSYRIAPNPTWRYWTTRDVAREFAAALQTIATQPASPAS